MAEYEWDAFISHASEDKEDFVRPLAEHLVSFGAQIWYDEFSLELGDSLSRSIDKGLANSRFGVVVLSPSFLKKDWPEYELRGLVARELGQDKVILPIWHNVKRSDILKFSPSLADKLALPTASLSLETIALRILAIIRPDIVGYIHARVAFKKAVAEAKIEQGDINDIKISPVRHKELSDGLVKRVRFVRAALLEVHPQNMEFWLDGFRRDLHPEDEIAFWERIASYYLEFSADYMLTPEQRQAAFKVILGLSMGYSEEMLREIISILPENSINALFSNMLSPVPLRDFADLPKSMEKS